QRVVLELQQGRGVGALGAVGAVLVVGVFGFLVGFFRLALVCVGRNGRIVILGGACFAAGVGVDHAVDEFVDLGFVARNAIDDVEHFGDRGRAGRDGLDHVLEAV